MRVPIYINLALLALSVDAKPFVPSRKPTYPFTLFEGQPFVEEISRKGQMDGPKIRPGVNSSSVDWWYFDAVSTTSQNESFAAVFYANGPDSFDLPYGGGPLTLQFAGTFENGTDFTFFAYPTEATVDVGPKGVSGTWKGAGGSFEGSSLDRPNPKYVVSFNNTEFDIHGTVELGSISPPHYPCDINKAGVSQQILPRYYWANAVPDAVATVDLTVQGKELKFSGNGYHDKNWATAHIRDVVRSWYWGHGRAGPYSLVWFNTITRDGEEHFSSWITKDGEVVGQSCESQAVVVRPWGENAEFPPPSNYDAPSGYTLKYDVGDQGTFAVNFTRELTTVSTDTYKRMIGEFTGGFVDGEQYTGRALCEQFQF